MLAAFCIAIYAKQDLLNSQVALIKGAFASMLNAKICSSVAFKSLIGGGLQAVLMQTMPQLLPFYFVNQLSFAVLVLGTLVYVFGTYVLPVFVELFVTRMYVTKL